MKKNAILKMGLCAFFVLTLIFIYQKWGNIVAEEKNSHDDFTFEFIKKVDSHSDSESYLVSPYSVELALSLLRVGASGETEKELNYLIMKRQIPLFESKDHISIANGTFVKNLYKEQIKTSFLERLTDYDADILYGDFATPDLINEWVSEKTFGMIDRLLQNISSDFIIGLANAVALDVEWTDSFDCAKTSNGKFMTSTGVKEVEMMHETYRNGVKYIDTSTEKGIILPYKKYQKDGNSEEISLEFVALMPNDDKTLKSYISSLSKEHLNDVIGAGQKSSNNQEINLALPRFSLDFELSDFKEILEEMGLKTVFTKNSDFTGIAEPKGSIKISEVIHKTNISLNEKGTKASAVTFFGFETTMAKDKPKSIDITFDKPFFYVIRDTESKEIIFAGTMYSPNEWHGPTCEGM